MYFKMKEKKFFKRICELPVCLIDIIKTYIPTITLIMLTKKCYLEKHVLLKSSINKKNSEVYIRCMIRQDNEFVFSNILFENYNRWLKMEQYYYKGYIYSNYIDFLESYCIEHESIRCRTIILNFLTLN
jgi:hypothetical protein